MIRNLFIFVITCAFALSSPCLAAPSQTNAPGTSVSLCQVVSQPERYLDGLVTIKVRVKTYRHGTSISDRACPKQALSLIVDDSTLKNDDVVHFYQLLAKHRQSTAPICATLTGRTVKGSDGGFVIKRDFAFKLESVAEVVEAKQDKTP